MADVREWAKRVGRAVPHVVVHHVDDGRVVTRFATKGEAMSRGAEMRKKGANVAVFSVPDYKKFVDPEWDESKHPRDESGRFA